MNKKKQLRFFQFDKHFIIITILAIGVVLTLSVSNQQTQLRQQAAPINNLNTAEEIETFNNQDWTMGPKSAKENFSTQLPGSYLGNLNLKITDIPKSSDPDTISLAISKIELHLIRLFIPGTNQKQNSNEQTMDNSKKTNQNINKWEVFGLDNKTYPFDINLISGLYNDIGTTRLANGKYSEIRIYISKAEILTSNGKKKEIAIPEGFKIIRIIKPFNIYSGKTTTLTIELDKKNSLIKAGNNLILKPIIPNIIITDEY